MTAIEHVILVDEQDNPIGTAEKLAAHRENRCHRAFSIFIWRQRAEVEILLQQRASDKYHSANLWTNTCCSHPRPFEEVLEAGQRRLKEEMNIEADLKSLGFFHYVAHFDNGLSENEVDHVLLGHFDSDVIEPNPFEVQAYQWMDVSSLKKQMQRQPDAFTPWLGQALRLVEEYFSNDNSHKPANSD